MGAIIAPVQLERIRALVAQGAAEGARLWQPTWAVPSEGCFYPPSLFTDVAPASTIAQVEIFGPVLVAMTFRTPAEAVALANNTPYGLAASVWSESLSLALDLSLIHISIVQFSARVCQPAPSHRSYAVASLDRPAAGVGWRCHTRTRRSQAP